jgi:hypothetical protein
MNPDISSTVPDDLKYLATHQHKLEDVLHLILMDSNSEQLPESMDLKPKTAEFI